MQGTQVSMLVANRYERLSQLGTGAMGVVYHVRDRLTHTELALKQVKVDAEFLAAGSDHDTASESRIALANEFQMLASLRHPNIVSVQDYGFDAQRQPFFTMTLLHEPQTLLEAAQDSSLETQANLLIQLLQSLSYVHRRGIMHRDLKPNNVLVRDQHVYVLDFGLATRRDGGDPEQTAGTLAYMAPEVLVGNPPAEAADLYAVGVIAYEMFSGHYPYNSDNPTSLIQDILQTPVPLDNLKIAPELRALLGRLLAKDPADRYTDANAVIRDLCAALTLPPPAESVEIRESFLQAATFVGREEERHTLENAVKQLVSEQTGSAFLIGGESGIGKSRLLNEISTRALVNGVMVLRGQMTSEGGLSYEMWRDALRRLALMVEIDQADAMILKTILPDLPELLSMTIPDLKDTTDLQKRLLLAIEHVLRDALAQRSILIVFEDLHWATESLTALETLAPLVDELPLMILGSYRNDERPDMPDMLPDIPVITLERLQATEIEQLSRSMLGQSGQQEGVVDLIQRETEGNVFFIVEVVRALAEEAGSLNQIGKATLPGSVFAGGVQRIVQRRLERVPSWGQRPLRLAAVAGRQLDLDLLRHALPDVDVDHWLTICSNAAVFDVHDAQWRFAHDKLRETVLADLIPAEKPAFHRAIAEAIEVVYSGYLDDYAPILVYHWAEAGDEQKEAAYLTRAADAMYERNEYHEMKRLYERALELEAHKQDDHPRKAYADLISNLGRAAYMLSEYDEVERWRQAALDIYRELDDPFGIAESLAALGEVLLRQQKNDPAIALVEQSRDLYESINERKKVAYADMNLAIIHSQKGDNTTALDYMQRSWSLMQEAGAPLDQARALNNLGVLNDLTGDLTQAKDYHNQALAIRRRINDRHGIAYSLNNLGAIAATQGDNDEAERLQVESLRLLRLLGEKMAQSVALMGLGDLYMNMTRYDEAELAYTEAMQLRRNFGNLSGVADAQRSLGNIARERGQFKAAWEHYLKALSQAEESGSEPSTNSLFYSVARLLVETGNPIPAVKLFASLRHSGFGDTDDIQQRLEALALYVPDIDYQDAVQQGEHATPEANAALVRSLAPR